jgi:chaperonin cofactor prefoldin
MFTDAASVTCVALAFAVFINRWFDSYNEIHEHIDSRLNDLESRVDELTSENEKLRDTLSVMRVIAKQFSEADEHDKLD